MKTIAEASRAGALAAVAVSLATSVGAIACSDAFHDDCHATRSCPEQVGGDGQGGSSGSASPGGTGGSGGGSVADGGSAAGEGGGSNETEPLGSNAGAAGEPNASCHNDADCDNADAEDGQESCAKGVCLPGNPPPQVVSITPDDGAEDVEPDAHITVVFSESLDPETVTSEAFKVFDGETEVSGKLEFGTRNKEVSFTPDAPFDLWTEYRVEIADSVADTEGVTLLDAASASFQVRDGEWSVQLLAQGSYAYLPSTLPIAPSGGILASWTVSEDGSHCSAGGRWLLRGQTKSGESFVSPSAAGSCTAVAASIAPGGDAGVVWSGPSGVLSKSFAKGAWQSQDRPLDNVSGSGDLALVVHDAQRMTVFTSQATRGGTFVRVDTGASTGTWSPTHQEFYDGGTLRSAFNGEGNGFTIWSLYDQAPLPVKHMAYDAKTGVWGAPAVVTGTESADAAPGDGPRIASVVMGPRGEAMVVWVKRTQPKQELMASRFIPGSGWQAPVLVSGKLLVDPISNWNDQPAVVFDGETYVSAWTARSGDAYLTYTARYDMSAKRWLAYESHISDLGDNLAFMPRLGADARGNLLLVWAIATDPSTLVYQRYRAATKTWGEPQVIAELSFADTYFEERGALPFAVAANGLGGLMVLDRAAGKSTLSLAEFF